MYIKAVARRSAILLSVQEDSDGAYFRTMAAKCRKMAASTNDPRAVQSLRQLAEEYEKAADAAVANEPIAKHIGRTSLTED